MTYLINVNRSQDSGVLTFTGANKTITTKCYWNKDKKIPAKTYKDCSATRMSRKKNSKGDPREAVFIPGVPGFSGIFIHMGKVPYQKWSDGCIVIDEAKMIEIYNLITPKDGRNVTVTVTG
ncbi:murein L,D-transpeptidase [Aliikangiella marina]|uniref:Murein L,D-transpeptidase n=1 Tax=Aliikangiella marina TaxID=1712262 RepID=A0A545TGR0_9GAMM|nr:L,D-transpeptidase family protein [Aliikangiella marina]TQV76403.1 murein L,D-transpeptidase [Aliikangiella marina]